MNLIFSADQNWGIGKDNNLLFRAKADLAYFRKMTTGKTVIMGRKTLESLPGGSPLPDRDNIVLTRDQSFAVPDATVCHSLEDLFETLAEKADDDIMIIGGEQIYRLLLPYSRRALVTRWEAKADADTSMPDLGTEEGWLLLEESPPRTEEDLTFRFCIYLHRTPTPWRKVV